MERTRTAGPTRRPIWARRTCGAASTPTRNGCSIRSCARCGCRVRGAKTSASRTAGRYWATSRTSGPPRSTAHVAQFLLREEGRNCWSRRHAPLWLPEARASRSRERLRTSEHGRLHFPPVAGRKANCPGRVDQKARFPAASSGLAGLRQTRLGTAERQRLSVRSGTLRFRGAEKHIETAFQ